ncbi:hypothetical protein ACIBI8_36085 [Streptomyces sp. NPDC050529]|uniref:hypothetical protein n=1 Tax=Streptomyces sp. NPDC050529 TaxID=3365624 RepID=UPI0037B49C2C
MTDVPARGRQDEAVDHWLAAQQKTFTNGLAAFLDVEEGLHEVLIYARHGGLVHELGNALDVEAGLAAILPPRTLPPDIVTTSADQAHLQQESNTSIEYIAPETRLILRSHPAIMASIYSGLVANALELAQEHVHPEHLYGDLRSVVARTHAYDLNSVLDRARDRELRGGDYHYRGTYRGTQGLEFALDLTDILHRALNRALNRTNARGDLDLALASALSQDHARDLVLALESALGNAHDLVRERALDPALGQAVDDALALARDLEHALDHALDRVARFLGLRTERLATTLLKGTLDDFTRADLRTVDLSGFDLAGVRWSQRGTHWPPTTDVELLKSKSQEVAAGSGIYVVRRGGPGMTVQGGVLGPSR